MADSSHDQGVTLLLSTTEDPASVNMVNHLLMKGGWDREDSNLNMLAEDGKVWARPGRSDLYLWQISSSFLFTDHLDENWTSATKRNVKELIFLSRHTARSGTPSLTVHTIGNPGQDPTAGEQGEHGGKVGKCVPPSSNLAPLFRLLHKTAKETGLLKAFKITLEATHHGPWHHAPTMFVEIGSKEEDWGRDDAAQLWADVLNKFFGLSSSSPQSNQQQALPTGPAVIGVGCGHYIPRFTTLLLEREDVSLGHCLANYALDFSNEKALWKEAIDDAVTATQRAFPKGHPLYVYIDKKSFKSGPRQELVTYLEAKGLKYGYKADDIH